MPVPFWGLGPRLRMRQLTRTTADPQTTNKRLVWSALRREGSSRTGGTREEGGGKNDESPCASGSPPAGKELPPGCVVRPPPPPCPSLSGARPGVPPKLTQPARRVSPVNNLDHFCAQQLFVVPNQWRLVRTSVCLVVGPAPSSL